MTMKIRHKNRKQENFPVGMMIFDRSKRQLVFDYYRFARYADDVADDPKLKPQHKVEQLYQLEDIFLNNKPYKGQKFRFVRELRQKFTEFGLSTSLATDLLIAFRKDAMGFEYQTWGQLVDYCKYSAAPVGRFMLAVHDENPSTYLPAASLCVALQIVNHIQDLKYDAELLGRIYLPSELTEKYHIMPEDLRADKSSPGLKKAIEKIMEKTRGLIKEGEILPQIIRSASLRAEVCIILSLTNIMVKKILKGDVLAKEIKLSAWNWLCGVTGGLIRSLFCKKKTLSEHK